MKENYLVMKVTIVKEVMKGDVSPVAMFFSEMIIALAMSI